LSAATGEESFTVTQIEKGQITVKGSNGQVRTLPAGSPGLKVGDKVRVAKEAVWMWDWGNMPERGAKPSVNHKNLPFDDGSKAK
jgi:hypothetical protein